MNIYDISLKAGVSIATVSRVINGNSYVSEKTREKVLRIIDECSYTPNAFARGLGLNTMNTVGIMCADASDPYLASAVYYLEQLLHQNGYDSLLCCTGYELDNKEKYLNLLLSKHVDAVILVGSNFIEAENDKNQYIRDASRTVPIMILNGTLDGENIFSTLCDDYHAVYEAASALKRNGCEHILYLYNSSSYSGNKKLSGFLAATGKNPSNPLEKNDYVQYVEGSIMDVKSHLSDLKKTGLQFDAIITSDDQLAIAALKYAKENNIIVPNELSIIGFNNSVMSLCSNPELTSIDNKLETLCCNCISTLMNYFKGQETPLKTVFSAEIVKRGTTSF